MAKYCVSDYCDFVDNAEYVIIANHELGFYFKINKKIWNNILYYIDNEITVDKKLRNIFDDLLEAKVIIEDKSAEYEIITLQLTNYCNLKCKHCCLTELTAVGEVDYQVIDKIIALKPKAIVLSGGEPMLHSDFWNIVNYIKDKFDGKLVLSTNGTLITNRNIDRICEIFDKISISLDGIIKNKVDIVRGQGVYEKIIHVIDLLKKKNIKIEVSTISVENDKEIVKRFENGFGVSVLKRELSITNKVFENFDKLVCGGKREYIKLKNNEFIEDTEIVLYKCGMIRYELYVSLDGNIYPCPGLAADKFVLKNINELKTLKEIRKVGSRKNIIKKMLCEDKFKRCRNCDYRGLCWSCLCVIDNFANLPELYEKWCITRKKLINQIVLK